MEATWHVRPAQQVPIALPLAFQKLALPALGLLWEHQTVLTVLPVLCAWTLQAHRKRVKTGSILWEEQMFAILVRQATHVLILPRILFNVISALTRWEAQVHAKAVQEEVTAQEETKRLSIVREACSPWKTKPHAHLATKVIIVQVRHLTPRFALLVPIPWLAL